MTLLQSFFSFKMHLMFSLQEFVCYQFTRNIPDIFSAFTAFVVAVKQECKLKQTVQVRDKCTKMFTNINVCTTCMYLDLSGQLHIHCMR